MSVKKLKIYTAGVSMLIFYNHLLYNKKMSVLSPNPHENILYIYSYHRRVEIDIYI